MLQSGRVVRRRLLEILSSHSLLTASEITKLYNNRYPPSRLGRLFGKGMAVRSVLKHLNVHCEAGLVRRELLSRSDQLIDRHTAHFTITPAGIQQLASRV